MPTELGILNSSVEAVSVLRLVTITNPVLISSKAGTDGHLPVPNVWLQQIRPVLQVGIYALRGGKDGRTQALIVILSVHRCSDADLFKVGLATRHPCLLPRLREPLCAYNGWDTSYAVISVADKEERNDGKDEGSRD